MKVHSSNIGFSELPTEVAVALYISGCVNSCSDCHSPWLRGNEGDEVTEEYLDVLITKYGKYTSCILFMGGDQYGETLIKALKYVKSMGLKTALYSGNEEVDVNIKEHLNYLKVGPYLEEFGGLASKTTNQRLYNLDTNEDITHLFNN